MTVSAPKSSSSAREILDEHCVITHFQPIFSVKQKSVIGVEALSRGINPETREIISPLTLFRMAKSENLSRELEQVCRQTALDSFVSLRDNPESMILFLNYDPTEVSGVQATDPTLLFLNYDAAQLDRQGNSADALVNEVQRLGLDPSRVAVEVLESRFEDVQLLKQSLDRLRERGFLLVLDDVGAGHSNLDRIPLIRPDIIKIDRSLITHIDTDYHKQETFKSLAQLARKIGSLVVGEGVETEGEALVALELGADLLQGFHLARPQDPGLLPAALDTAGVEHLARQYKAHMVRKINERKTQHRRYAIIQNEILCELSNARVSSFDEVLHRLIQRYPQVEALYVMDEAGIQVTDTICAFRSEAPRGRLMFRPAAKGADHSLKEFYYVLLDVELQKYTTDPYVSLASGNICRTISTCFRDGNNTKLYILCIDVVTGLSN
ncbi:MAG TPA: EAL domain-containing protein [Tepidisphaeraceae bacterium]|jgi:EAL domain-containing protein (putative c-di-GMP-specific phosphodiesterase class I)|nr:EAL domain-containing protein [Tepidisphaeraceae bacterium]